MYDALVYIMEYYEVDMYSSDEIYFMDLTSNGTRIPPVTIANHNLDKAISEAYRYTKEMNKLGEGV